MGKSDIRGKNVLLLAPSFFQYEDAIVAELKERGASVDYLNSDLSRFSDTISSSLSKLSIVFILLPSSCLNRKAIYFYLNYPIIITIPNYCKDFLHRNNWE